jgi:hypothetical protein
VTHGDFRKQLIVASLIVGALVVVAQSVAHLVVTVGLGACDATGFAPCPSTFDLDHNNGISDVVSTIVIGVAAAGAAVLGATRRGDRRALTLASVLVLITFDDAFHTEDNLGSLHGVVVLGTIAVAALLTIWVAASSPPQCRWFLWLGTGLLALDVKMPFLYDQLMNTIGQPSLLRGDLLYELGVVLDEAMELAGWILIGIGLWDAALTTRGFARGRREMMDGHPVSAQLFNDVR